MDRRELLMALDKVVDSAALDAGMTSVADAIRAKAGTTKPLAWPDGFAAAISGIETGGSGASWVTVATELPYDMFQLGDVNMDGSITQDDAAEVGNYGSGTDYFSSVQKVLADVDFDGEISIIDAMAILDVINGTYTPPLKWATAVEYAAAKKGDDVKAVFEITISGVEMTAPTYAYVPLDGIIAIYSGAMLPAGTTGLIQILK